MLAKFCIRVRGLKRGYPNYPIAFSFPTDLSIESIYGTMFS